MMPAVEHDPAQTKAARCQQEPRKDPDHEERQSSNINPDLVNYGKKQVDHDHGNDKSNNKAAL
ncbi:hypothetical protein AA15973_1619 [Komagataeibacter sucrofermentans DSM 15973]|nr:hypothetical protein AA15973_1619 [Komagataeibacter sucrofermentans DSM 15973]